MNEDELRAAMQSHDAEAPRADELEIRPVHRRPALPIAAAAIVTAVLVAVIAVIWTRPSDTAPGALDKGFRSPGATAPPAPPGLRCPKSVQDSRTATNGWTPAAPQTSNPSARLVPDRTPTAAVVCSYSGHFVTSGPRADSLQHSRLEGSRTLAGDLRAIASDLARAPRGHIEICAASLVVTDRQYYEIGLSYRGKVVWVAAPGNHCKGTTNGVFNGSVNLRLPAEQAYEWGTWATDPALKRLCHGQPDPSAPTALPANPTRITVCTRHSGSSYVLRADHPGNGPVDAYNNAVATKPHHCGLASRDPYEFKVRFDYANGSTALVSGDATCVTGPGKLTFADSDTNALTTEPFDLP